MELTIRYSPLAIRPFSEQAHIWFGAIALFSLQIRRLWARRREKSHAQ
jgi:hypothetical protein